MNSEKDKMTFKTEEKVSTCIFPRPFYPILIPKPHYMVFGGPPEGSNLNFGVGASAAKSWEKSKSFRHESFRIKGIQPPELETKEDFVARNGVSCYWFLII